MRDPASSAGETHYYDHIYLPAAHDRNERRTRWVVALTAVCMVGEIVAGWLTGSMALLADGFHMATHAGALAVAAGAYAFARRHAHNARFTFGTGKVGDLAGFASALMLGLASLGIALESGLRLASPRPVDFADATLVALIGLAVNIVSALLLSGGHGEHGGHHHHGHGHDHDHGHKHDHAHADNNLRAAYLHVLADALTSVAAIAALLAGRFLGWLWLDPFIGLLGALVIARWAWGLMKDTSAVLLDTAEPERMAQVRALAQREGAAISDLHVWRIGPHAHAVILSMSGSAESVDRLRTDLLAMPGVAHVTIEMAHGAAGGR